MRLTCLGALAAVTIVTCGCGAGTSVAARDGEPSDATDLGDATEPAEPDRSDQYSRCTSNDDCDAGYNCETLSRVGIARPEDPPPDQTRYCLPENTGACCPPGNQPPP